MASRSISCSAVATVHPAVPRRDPAASLIAAVPSRRRSSGRLAVAVGVKRYKGTVLREEKLAEMIETKVAEAMEACEGDKVGEEGCRVAWDEVEEVSQAKADLRRRAGQADPLESYCGENPEEDECSVYEDDRD